MIDQSDLSKVSDKIFKSLKGGLFIKESGFLINDYFRNSAIVANTCYSHFNGYCVNIYIEYDKDNSDYFGIDCYTVSDYGVTFKTLEQSGFSVRENFHKIDSFSTKSSYVSNFDKSKHSISCSVEDGFKVRVVSYDGVLDQKLVDAVQRLADFSSFISHKFGDSYEYA